ncbi:MAG: type II secretion system F family protein [Pseudomonadota bacterium]
MKPLPDQALSELYMQLGQLYKAGLTHHDALKQLSRQKTPTAERARRTIMYLNRGKPLPESGVRAGLFAETDKALLEAADMSGNYVEIYHSLASMYEDHARYRRQVRSRLTLPAIMLIAAVFVPPLPDIVRGTLPVSEYFANSISLLIAVAAGFFTVVYLPGILRRNGARPLIDTLELIMPYFGPWALRRQLCQFMQILALLLRCGVPILDALPKACDAAENTVLQRRLRFLKSAIEDGDSLADALSTVRGVNQHALSMARIGEHSGALDSMLQHYVAQETEALANRDAALAAWLPRLIYAGVVGFIIYSLLTGGGVVVIM